MHLLNTNTLRLESFADNKIPGYVILSHRWGIQEVSYQEIQHYEVAATTQVSNLISPPTPSLIEEKAGFLKIKGACKIAFENGYEYIWIDTCCIDKTSSAELSEAINSMYNWYSKADICYTYLSDVLDDEAISVNLEGENDSSFAASRWFTRGWTLQELIASTKIHFYSQGWLEIGTKVSLKTELSKITGIDIEVLDGQDSRSMSVAKRMSWASQRETERKEDTAYCLMGLFDINMPLLYGEGEKAFIRLQEEIIKGSDDHSIFAWNDVTDSGRPCNLLAPSPAYFSDSGNISPIYGNRNSPPFTMTNQGLCIELALIKMLERDWYLAPLNCQDSQHAFGPHVIILVKANSSFGRMHQFFRIGTPRYFLSRRKLFFDLNNKKDFDRYAESKTICIRRNSPKFDLPPYRPRALKQKL